jgi:hypothetical protein
MQPEAPRAPTYVPLPLSSDIHSVHTISNRQLRVARQILVVDDEVVLDAQRSRANSPEGPL